MWREMGSRCKLFKAGTDEQFVEFVLGPRMAEAKQLLTGQDRAKLCMLADATEGKLPER